MMRRFAKSSLFVLSGSLFTVCLIYWTLTEWSNANYDRVYGYHEPGIGDGDGYGDWRRRAVRLPDLPELRDLSHRILEVTSNLRTSAFVSAKDLVELRSVAVQLYPPIDEEAPSSTSDDSNTQRTDVVSVCPEVYVGSEKLDDAWTTAPGCNDSEAIQRLVTVLLLASRQRGPRVVQDFQDSYPGIRVIVFEGYDEENKDDDVQADPWSWTSALHRVHTEYVLVARNLYRFSSGSSPLERLVRVSNESPLGLVAVGGSIRNSSGHWSANCFQTRLRHYALTYTAGYYHSSPHLDCMYCDYVDGPFLVRRRLLQLLLTDVGGVARTVGPRQLRFADWFLSLGGRRRALSVSCPDSMFYADGDLKSATDAVDWLPLARKWQLNRVAVHADVAGRRTLHRFTCAEVGLRCDRLQSSSAAFAMPICCREQLSTAFRLFAEFCANNSIAYYFDSGTALGAVKMADVLPWDFDGDVLFNEDNHTVFESERARRYFERRGLRLARVTSHSATRNSLFHLWTPDVFIELYGVGLSADAPKTWMQVSGSWIRGPANPGRYARGRYGSGCLRHAPSWRHTGARNSYAPYVINGRPFAGCPKPLHHSCLDRFPVDGNIPFMIPNE